MKKINQNFKELRFQLAGGLLSTTLCLYFYFKLSTQDNLFFVMSLWFFLSGALCDLLLITKPNIKTSYYAIMASKVAFCSGLVCALLFAGVNL